MKKVLSLFVCFLLSFNMCFAAYQPIPKEKSKQYKIEVENIIVKEVPKAKQEVQEIFIQAQKAYQNKSIEDLDRCDRIIGTPEFYLYKDVINVTNKYVNIEKDIPATDYEGALYDFLYPYFKDNNIDLTQLDELTNLCGEKSKEIERMIQSLSN